MILQRELFDAPSAFHLIQDRIVDEPSMFTHPRHMDWEARVRQLEEAGDTRSDAQSAADVEYRFGKLPTT